MIPDPEKFPNGIKGVADKIHDLGLKVGIYSSTYDEMTDCKYVAYSHPQVLAMSLVPATRPPSAMRRSMQPPSPSGKLIVSSKRNFIELLE